METLGLVGSLDDLQRPLPELGKGCLQFGTGIAAIRKDMAQPGEKMADRRQQIGRAIAILEVGGVYLRRDETTAGMGDDVALAPIDLLARIIAARPAAFRCLDRLAVDHPGR